MKKRKLVEGSRAEEALDKKQGKKRITRKDLQNAETAIANPNLRKRKPKLGKRSPFSNLGKDENGGTKRFSKLPTQGTRLTGKTLLAKAMKRMAKKK